MCVSANRGGGRGETLFFKVPEDTDNSEAKKTEMKEMVWELNIRFLVSGKSENLRNVQTFQ